MQAFTWTLARGPIRAIACFLAAGALVSGAALRGAAGAEAPTAEVRQRNERAMALFAEARAAYEHGEYRAAIQKLEEAILLDPDKELFFSLALVHEKLGEIDEAERNYERYLTMEPEPKQRDHVQQILKRLEGAKRDMEAKQRAQREHAAAPPPPAPLAPSAPPAPAPEPRHTSPWVYTFGGTAVGALVAGGALGISAVTIKPGKDATTGPGQTYTDLKADAATAHRHAILADVSFAIAALSGGVAIYLGMSGRSAAKTAPSAPVASVALAFGRADLEVRF